MIIPGFPHQKRLVCSLAPPNPPRPETPPSVPTARLRPQRRRRCRLGVELSGAGLQASSRLHFWSKMQKCVYCGRVQDLRPPIGSCSFASNAQLQWLLHPSRKASNNRSERQAATTETHKGFVLCACEGCVFRSLASACCHAFGFCARYIREWLTR